MGYGNAILYAVIVGTIGLSVGVLMVELINASDSLSSLIIIIALFTVSGAAAGWEYGKIQK